MPADQITSSDDSAARLARYKELKGKADMLIGQHFKLLQIIEKLDDVVDSLAWEGIRATKFRAEWASRRAELSGWAGRIAAASHKLSDEADNYKD